MASLLDLAQIVLIDLSMAADNALVVGMAVTALPVEQRRRATVAGIGAATILRIVMAFFAVQLLQVMGLLLAGGLLLVWVAWKMLREFQHLHRARTAPSTDKAPVTPAKKMSQAVWQIIVADISMSLDNVLGVAGVARDHKAELVIGLILSVALMGFAATFISRLTVRYPRIALIGVAIILYTAVNMIVGGSQQILSVHS